MDVTDQRVRRDPEPVDPAWAPPSPPVSPPESPPESQPESPSEPEPSPRRSGLITGIVLLALLLVGGGLWAAGAFADRTDRAWPTPAGTTVTSGPYELRFGTLSVQKKQDYADTVYFEAKASGTGRTTADQTMVPSAAKDSGMFLLRDDRTRAVTQPDEIRWGADLRIGDGAGFNPGLPPSEFTVVFKLPADARVPTSMTLAVFDLELRDNSLLGDQEPAWRNADHYFTYVLPVTRLPDDL